MAIPELIRYPEIIQAASDNYEHALAMSEGFPLLIIRDRKPE
jgi:hypothetical protein